MALDHYVSQVHLRQFYSPVLNNKLMYAIRKNDLNFFTPNSESVCRIDEGNTNLYLKGNERIVEEFLKSIEPNYSDSLNKLQRGKIDKKCIYTIAGFITYILTCSPASMRMHSSPLEKVVKQIAHIIDSKGELPSVPDILKGKSLSELLNTGEICCRIDQKYSQAMGIIAIFDLIKTFGNSFWEIMINPFHDNPFFTSDFPIAIEMVKGRTIINKIIPLSPEVAVKVCINSNSFLKYDDFSFPNFQCKIKTISYTELVRINKLIVQCAENLVFFRDNDKWIYGFIKKNSNFHVEIKTDKISTIKGTCLYSEMKVCPIDFKN